MTSGEDWQNDVKEEGDNESMLVDVESHEDLPNMKRENNEDSYNDQSATLNMVKNQTPPELREWLKHFRALVLAPIFRNAKSNPFRKPVDAVALGIYPVYYEIVKNPMDLGTIRQKIDDGVYLKKEEATADLMLVWDNAMTFNQPGHFIYETAAELKAQSQSKLEKLERDGIPPANTPKPIPAIQVKRDSLVRRDARKKSFDLPGEISTPQHLEQKYVSKLSSSLKSCDSILKNLMSLKLHRDYVEPFIHVERKTESDAYQPMSLSKIQQRLRSLQYSHPMEFADDMRRIVTETYRYCYPDDPIVSAAAKLQQEFEMLFAKINFQENELVPPILAVGGDQLREDDEYISKLLSAQNFMVQIQTDLTELIKDYMRMKSKKTKKRKLVTPSAARPSTVTRPTPATPATPVARSIMQGQLVQRPLTSGKQISTSGKQMSTSGKQFSTSGKQFTHKPEAESPSVPPPKKKPRTDSTSSSTPSKPVLTLQEANLLKEEISKLEPSNQFKVLEILQANGEKMMPDANGEVEIEIFRCSAKSVADVKAFLNFVKSQQRLKNIVNVPSGSGKGKVMSKPSEAENHSTLSDSSSDSNSSSDSSSDDSSDSSSDSDDDN